MIKRKLFYVVFPCLVSGCILNVLEPSENQNRIFDYPSLHPNASNNYEGLVQVGKNISQARSNEWMLQRCRNVGMVLGEVRTSTPGPHSTPNYYKCISSASNNISAPPQLSPQSISVTPSNNITIDVAKQKCQELGFKSGTEAFGKCVLQLTK